MKLDRDHDHDTVLGFSRLRKG